MSLPILACQPLLQVQYVVAAKVSVKLVDTPGITYVEAASEVTPQEVIGEADVTDVVDVDRLVDVTDAV